MAVSAHAKNVVCVWDVAGKSGDVYAASTDYALALKWLADNQTVNPPPGSPVNSLMARREPTELFPLPPGVWIAAGLALAGATAAVLRARGCAAR